jgi:tetratricopeptide (TPR) repeat protein
MADKKEDSKATAAATPTPVHIGGETLADRIAPHIKKILIGVVVIAVIVTIVLAFRWRKHAQQEQQTAKLMTVLDVGHTPVGPMPMMIPGQEPTEQRFATSKERATSMLDAIAKAGTEGTTSFKAALLLDAGKTDEAIAAYRKGITAKGVDGVLAREGLGISLETKALAEADAAARQKLFEEALATFTSMQPDAQGPRRAYALYHYALYHQGRLQQRLGKRDEAKALFEKAKELGESTELPELIDRRLAQL